MLLRAYLLLMVSVLLYLGCQAVRGRERGRGKFFREPTHKYIRIGNELVMNKPILIWCQVFKINQIVFTLSKKRFLFVTRL